MLAAHGPAPLHEHGHDCALDADQVDENRRRRDIRDRIDRAHLVKVHLLDRQAVGLGLGLGEDAEGAAGEFGCAGSERGRLDDGEDVGEVAMGVMVAAVSRMVMAVGVGVAGMVVMAAVLARVRMSMQIRHVVVVVLMHLVQHHVEVQT